MSDRPQTDLEREHANYLRSLQKVMNTPEGRDVIWEILRKCKVYQKCFTGNSETFYNEGKRNVGLEVLAEVNTVSFNEYIRMQQEKHKQGKT